MIDGRLGAAGVPSSGSPRRSNAIANGLVTQPPTRSDDSGQSSREADYHRYFESIHEPALILTPEEIVIDVNDEACRVYGFSRNEFVGLDMKTISVDVSEGQRQMARVLAGESVRFESRQLRCDGTPFLLDIHALPIPYEGGVAVLTLNRDVTEERRRESDFVDSEDRYRNLFEGAPIGICRAGFDGRMLAANHFLVSLLGYPDRAELLAVPLHAHFLRQRERLRFESDLLRDGFARGEFRLARKDSTIIYVDVQARIASDVVEAFVIDVTARREAEMNSQHLAAEVHRLLQAAYEGIIATDADGRCTLVNESALLMFGVNATSAAGTPLHAMIHFGCSDPLCWILRAQSTSEAVRIEERLYRNGEPFPAEITLSPIVIDGNWRGAVWSFLDISERTATARRLEVAERVAGLGRLATAMAHDFNNVLMAIIPVCDVLERRVADDKLRRLVQGMKSSALRGRNITREILRYSRQNEPVVTPIAVPSYLDDLRHELAKVVGPNIGVRIQLPDESLRIIADGDQLREAFIRLAENARDAMPGGGVITISATRDRAGPHVHFEVTDIGAGMTPTVLKKALEPMFTTKQGATGLGLALVHKIVKDHGGQIFLESDPGKGTSVHLLLPLDENGNSLDVADRSSTGDRHRRSPFGTG